MINHCLPLCLAAVWVQFLPWALVLGLLGVRASTCGLWDWAEASCHDDAVRQILLKQNDIIKHDFLYCI